MPPKWIWSLGKSGKDCYIIYIFHATHCQNQYFHALVFRLDCLDLFVGADKQVQTIKSKLQCMQVLVVRIDILDLFVGADKCYPRHCMLVGIGVM